MLKRVRDFTRSILCLTEISGFTALIWIIKQPRLELSLSPPAFLKRSLIPICTLTTWRFSQLEFGLF